MTLHLEPLPSDRVRLIFVKSIRHSLTLFQYIPAARAAGVAGGLRAWWREDRRERLIRRIAREKVHDRQRTRALMLNAHITNTTRY